MQDRRRTSELSLLVHAVTQQPVPGILSRSGYLPRSAGSQI
jgi:hypothetical protein